MNTLHMMVGLPRSGKSTEARKLGYPIVEPDAIRRVLYEKPFDNKNEMLVWGLAKTMVQALFEAGHKDVTLDACNLTNKMRSGWYSEGWFNDYHFVKTSKEECIKRAKDLGQDYLIEVIERMSASYEPLEGEDC
jgi:predicted kinase